MAHEARNEGQEPVKKVFGPAEFKPLGSVEELTKGLGSGTIDSIAGTGLEGGFGPPLT